MKHRPLGFFIVYNNEITENILIEDVSLENGIFLTFALAWSTH